MKATPDPGKGKHIVLIAGDDEYRSEEALSQLGRILADHHGFKCTVLFAVDPDTGIINPARRNNIPGLEALDTADLTFIFSRWRALPDEQMWYFDSYLRAGKPLVAMRTATHGFAPPEEIHDQVMDERPIRSRTSVLNSRMSNGEPTGTMATPTSGPNRNGRVGSAAWLWARRWVAHHGHHKHESTLGILAPGVEDHPILRGIKDGDIWGPSDVYTVGLPLPGDSKPLVLGQVMKRKGRIRRKRSLLWNAPRRRPPRRRKEQPHDAGRVDEELPASRRPKQGQVFVTTMGASTDLVSEGMRRIIVNGVYWALGMADQIPETGAKVDLVGTFEPKAVLHPQRRLLGRAAAPPGAFSRGVGIERIGNSVRCP